MLFLITICKISSRFRYFGMDLVSYRAIFPVSVQLNHIHPLRQNRNSAKIKSTPAHLYHTKILGYISSNAHTSPIDHTIKEPYTTNNIYQKKVFCIASRLTTTEKDIPTAYPYIADCTISAQITQTRQPYISHQTRTIQRYYIISDHSTSPRVQHSQSIHPYNYSPTHPHSRYRPHSHFRNLRQSGITFCTTQ